MTLLKPDADAILKSVTTSITTAILIVFSILFFRAPISFVSLSACAIIFLSTFSYIRAAELVPHKTAVPHRFLAFVWTASLFIGVIIVCSFGGIGSPDQAKINEIESETCPRPPLPESDWVFNGTRQSHHFDDVLVIAFWNNVGCPSLWPFHGALNIQVLSHFIASI